MRMFKKIIALLLITLICCFIFSDCGENANNCSNISYGDIVYERICGKDKKSLTKESIQTNLFKTYEDANRNLFDLGVSPGALSMCMMKSILQKKICLYLHLPLMQTLHIL